MLISESIGFIAGAVGLASFLPQILRIRKLGHSIGVSLPTWLIMYASTCSWLGYGIATRSPAQWVTNTVAAGLTITVLLAILANRSDRYLILVVIPVVFITFAVAVPVGILSTVLLAFSAMQLPQVVKSWNTWKNSTPSAVSIHMLLLAALDTGLWLAYGVLGRRGIVELSTGVQLFLMTLVLGLELASARDRVVVADR